MDKAKLAQADKLEAEAKRLRQEAFDERPLPDFWRVGQIVRYIANKEHAFGPGTIASIVEVRSPDTPANKYNVFWTSRDGRDGRWWTTPDEVELVKDVKTDA